MGAILVTGATRNVGRLVVDRLLDAGATNVRALTVDPEAAALPNAVEVAVGSIFRPETLPAALAGVGRLYLAPHAPTVHEVVALAKDAGVERIVDLSSTEAVDVETGDEDAWGSEYVAIERAVEASGLAWTHLRAGEYMTNALDWADQIRSRGVVRWPCAACAYAPIDPEDIAVVAAAALLEDGHVGKAYMLTGPEPLRRDEMVHVIGQDIGRDLRFEEQPYEEALEAFTETMGEWAKPFLDGLVASAGIPQQPGSGVFDATGRPPTDFLTWATRNAAAFA